MHYIRVDHIKVPQRVNLEIPTVFSAENPLMESAANFYLHQENGSNIGQAPSVGGLLRKKVEGQTVRECIPLC